MVAWEKVMRPIDLGGLGIHNLEVMLWALEMRWLWFEKKNNPNLPWAGLEIPVHLNTTAMFSISMVTVVGNGTNTSFWTDRWLLGTSLEELAPSVFKFVPLRVCKTRTVAQALVDYSWLSDIRGALSWHGLMEYLELSTWSCGTLFQIFSSTIRKTNTTGSSGIFSTRSAYRAFFVGAIHFEPWKRLWKAWAPNKCKSLFGLLFVTVVGQLITSKKGDYHTQARAEHN